jgi:hypothetical protein
VGCGDFVPLYRHEIFFVLYLGNEIMEVLMGRKLIGDRPLTATERSHRRRAKPASDGAVVARVFGKLRDSWPVPRLQLLAGQLAAYCAEVEALAAECRDWLAANPGRGPQDWASRYSQPSPAEPASAPDAVAG